MGAGNVQHNPIVISNFIIGPYTLINSGCYFMEWNRTLQFFYDNLCQKAMGATKSIK